MLAPLPLGLTNVSKKVEEGAIAKDKKQRELAAQQRAAAAAAEDAARNNVETQFRQLMTGPMKGLGKSRATANDPDLLPKPPITGGVGGPQDGPPQDEIAALEAELKRREEIQALEAELANRMGGQQPQPQQAPGAPLNTDAMINEAVAQYPGGYKGWMEKNKPAPAGQRYERDALAKGEQYYLAPDQAPGKPQEFGGNNSLDLGLGRINLGERDAPWNEQVASVLESLGNQIMTPITGRQVDPANDPMKAMSKAFVEPMVKLPGAAFRDPVGTFEAVDPSHQMARAYGATQNALSNVFQGNWSGATEQAGNALVEGGNAALGLAGIKSLTAPRNPLAVKEPTLRQAGKTLAAEIVPGRKIRPQAYDGIANILINSGVPRDRIAGGFARIVQGLKALPDGVTNREATVAQLFKREFGEEFPQVLDSIDAHLRGAALSLKPGDIRPGIINSVAVEMRDSQIPFIQESGRKNLGENGLFAKEGQALAEMERLVEEGYKPILAKPVGIKAQLAIQEVLQDPATAPYLKALEQDALENGTTVGKMIATNPVEAAHWIQSKARAVADANPDLRRTATQRRGKILDVLEANVPGYRETRLKFGDQYGAADSVGLGDNFLAVGRNEYKLEKLLETYEGLSETQKPVGLASIWNAINTKIRGTQAKPGTPARTAEIATIGTIDALNRLGPRGKAFADDLMAVAEENDFLTAITQRGKSPTATNAQAIKEGDRLATKSGRLVPESLGTDVAAMGAGVTHAPIVSTFKALPEAINSLRTPRLSTREDMARILMARPKVPRNALAPEPTPPKGPPTGTPPPGGGPKGPPTSGGVLTADERAFFQEQMRNPLGDEKPAPAPVPTKPKPSGPKFGRKPAGSPPGPIQKNGMFANPVGFKDGASAKKGNPARVDFEPRDLILARNEKDGTYYDTGIALGMADNDKVTPTIAALVNRTRKTIEQAKRQTGGIDELARQWNVTPDELENFLVRQQKNPNTGSVDEALNKAADIIESFAKQGSTPSLEVIVDRMHAADIPLAASSLKTLLSKARTGNVGGHAISQAVQDRIRNLPPLPRGRPYMAGAATFAQDGRLGHAIEGAAMAGSGVGGWLNAKDMNDDGEVSLSERMMQAGASAFATKALTGAARSRMGKISGGKQFNEPNWNSFGGKPVRAENPRGELPNLVEDATDESLQKMQLDMIARGEVPPVFKTFRLPNGRIIAWNGDESRGGMGHEQARDLLGLGNMRLEHGQSYLGGPPLSKTNWYSVSGEGEAPRSVETMVRQGTKQGRQPGDVIQDAYPHEIERDLRGIGAMGPGDKVKDYSQRRRLATEPDVRVSGSKRDGDVYWKAPNGVDMRMHFGNSDEPIVNLYLGGRQTRDGGVLQTDDGKFSRALTQAETKQTFEKAFSVLEREVIRRGKDAYHFTGASDAHIRLYAGAMERLGAPQGYVALVDKGNGFFALFKQARLDELVKAGRVDPKDWTIIPSKRGSAPVPDWRRATGQFALPLAAGGAMANALAPPRTNEPRPK